MLRSGAIRRKKRRFSIGLTIVVAIAWVASTGIFAYRSVHRSEPQHAEPIPPSLEGVVEPLRLSTSDGFDLGAWLARPANPSVAILLLHGLGSSRTNQVDIISFLARSGCIVLAPTFRAHGDSTGEQIDFGYSSRLDVLAALEKLKAEAPGLPLIIFGRSMGAAAALFAAEDIKGQAAAYLLESPYADLETATRNRLRLHLPIPLDSVVLFGLHKWADVLLPVPFVDVAPVRYASTIPDEIPIVIMAGGLDRRATLEEAKWIARQAKDHSRVVIFTKSAHDELWSKEDLLYKQTIMALVERVRGAPGQPAPTVPEPQTEEAGREPASSNND